MTSIKTFKVEKKYLDTLNENEKKILPLLVSAAKKIDEIFILQENNKYPGANFYPYDATREQIETAAKEDSRIFSPYTIIERDKYGKLITVDYHQKYEPFLTPIIKLLTRASEIAKNKSFKNYLEKLTVVLIDGSYQRADIAWLDVKDSNLDLVIGPYERYLDKLFFIKRAYQASLSIIDTGKTRKARVIRDILFTTIGERPHRVILPAAIDIRINQCLILSGFLGRILFSEQYLPSDSDTIEKYGSRIVGYVSSINYKFDSLLFPIFKVIFEKSFRESYTKEVLETGNYYYVLLSAIAQQLHRYENSRDNLRELFPIFDEANSAVSGIQHAKHLVLKGVINQKELEAMIIMQICWFFSEWVLSKKTNVREDYLKGDAVTFNFLIKEGALQEKDGISWPNFAKMFFTMENLASIFTRLLEKGNYSQAKELLVHYLSFEQLKLFDRRLSRIKPI